MSDSRGTREKILDTAERIFAEQGFDACSIRALTSQAGVNLASVHYHFGSKEGLIREVLERRVSPVNEQRLESLAELDSAEPPPSLETILDAIIRPYLRLSLDAERGQMTRRLFDRVVSDPGLRPMIGEVYKELGNRMVSVFRRALPELPREDLAWRIHLALGAIDSIGSPDRLIRFCSRLGWVPSADEEDILNRISSFVIAGMTAPVPPSGSPEAEEAASP